MRALLIWLVRSTILSQTRVSLQRQAGSAFCSHPEGYLEADRDLLYSGYVQCQSLYWASWLWIMRPSTLRPWGPTGLTRMWKRRFGPFPRWRTFGDWQADGETLACSGDFSIRELATSNPDQLQKALGQAGLRLWFHANGIDESNVHRPYKAKSQGLGNSQILPRDYVKLRDIEIILREMAEQVAIRLRRAGKKTTLVSIYVGFSKQEVRPSIHTQMKVEPTNNTAVLTDHVLKLFHNKYTSGAVRSVESTIQDLWTSPLAWSPFWWCWQVRKEERLQTAIDAIREQFGFTSLLKANALKKPLGVLPEASWLGGHSAGGLDGLKWLIVLIYPFHLRVTIKIRDAEVDGLFSLQSILVHLVKKKKSGSFFDEFEFRWELLLLSQLYVGQLKGCFVVKEKKQKRLS